MIPLLCLRNLVDTGFGQNFDTGPVTLGQQQLQNLLAGFIAEQLPRGFLVVFDTVTIHQLDKVGRLETAQCRLAEMGIIRKEVGR